MLGSARAKLRTWITAGAGTIAAVLIAGLLGAFGSLEKPLALFEPGAAIETGQWIVRPLSAYVATKGIYGAPVKSGEKALVIEVELTNRTAQSSKDYFALIQPREPIGNPVNTPFIVLTRDSTLSPALHPGMTERVAYVWPMPEAAAPPDALSLGVTSKSYKQRDNLYGLPGWFNEHEIGTVNIPVEASPEAAGNAS